MVADFFSSILDSSAFILDALIWICIIIFFITAKGFYEKFKLLVLVSGFVLLSNFIPHFPIAPIFIAAWLIIGGIEFFFSKELLIFLLAVLVFVDLSNPFFFILGMTVYILIMSNFILAGFALLDPKKTA